MGGSAVRPGGGAGGAVARLWGKTGDTLAPPLRKPGDMLARLWRSPADQPKWARPALSIIALIAGLAYAWGMNGAALENIYGAAARSMSLSWSNFFFGAFDPKGTVSVDKLPGALWPQALSLRLFGFHIWALVLPQVIEGVLTILVLYRVVRRLAGPAAGITAAAVLAVSPVTVALNRGNVADSLLILLLVLAADATVSALDGAKLRSLLIAGVWVGLAFQAKMTVAWLVLPALALVYLLAAPATLRARSGHLLAAGGVTLLVSLSWMSLASLVPAHDRPYVDGTQNNSLFSQVFDYNGLARLKHTNVYAGAGHPAPFLVKLSEAEAAPAHRVTPSWHRLLGGLFGREDGWLLPAALLAALAVLLDRRRAERQDRLRAGVVLWGTWLLIFGAFFSAGGYPNPYYVAALAPAVAGLCGAGVELARRRATLRITIGVLLGALLGSVGYGLYLLKGGTDVPHWLVPVAVVAALAGAAQLLLTRLSGSQGVPLSGRALTFTVAAALILPAVASALMVSRGLGPFAAPYEPASGSPSRAQAKAARQLDEQIVEEITTNYGTPIAFATDSSILAAPYIFTTGREILPIGGYQGGIPAPSLTQLQRYVSAGELRIFIVPTGDTQDKRIAWIHADCSTQAPKQSKALTALYDCASKPAAG
jgi:4-amino-4-deoxy-L-arabinose transferase-like glycosyltransferase